MTQRVIWHRLAGDDVTEAYLYSGADSPTAAERLLDALEHAVQFLAENPGAGRQRQFGSPRAHDVRSWGVKGFPAYLIFYRATSEEFEVVRVIHGARDLPRLLEDLT